jgi:putative inorganic carbon (HCO3(-)) transporter
MKYLLMLLIIALVGSGLTGIDISLAPGVSLKNLFLYLAAALLAARALLLRDLRFELPGITTGFLVIFLYAVVTWITAGAILDYEGYRFVDSGMQLKNRLLDYLFLFWVAFYGLTRDDAREALAFLLAVFGFAHVLGIAYYFGYVNLEGLYNPYDARLRGFIGEANQYGTLNACFLPVMIAQVFATRSTAAKMFWAGLALTSFVALLLTGSRGALVGLLIGGALLIAVYPRILPMRRLVVGGVAAVIAGAAFVAVLSVLTGNFLYERFIGDSLVVGEMSSGRVEIWLTLLHKMADAPLTFITGYGWNAYFSMPFRWWPHNTFLLYWFDLGLVGLVAFCWILWASFSRLRSGALAATGDRRPLLIGASIGIASLAASACFVELPAVWPYVWMLVGLGLRLASRPLPAPAQVPARHVSESVASSTPRPSDDPYGWQVRNIS